MKKAIESKKAPAAIGPYSQGIKMGDFLFCSGQIGVSPKTNVLVSGGIKQETKQAFMNLGAVLKEAGADFDTVVKVNVYLANMDDFPVMNEIYATFFKNPYPARATVEVARLPKGAQFEIECIAYINCPPSHKASEGERECCGEDCCRNS